MAWVHDNWVRDEVQRVAPNVTFISSELFDYNRRFEVVVQFPKDKRYRVDAAVIRGKSWLEASEDDIREGACTAVMRLVNKYG